MNSYFNQKISENFVKHNITCSDLIKHFIFRTKFTLLIYEISLNKS